MTAPGASEGRLQPLTSTAGDGFAALGGPRWDWYQGTVHGVAAESVVSRVARGFGWRAVGASPVEVEPCRPQHGYRRGMRFSADGEQLAEIWFEGNPGVHVWSSGAASQRLAEIVQGAARSRGWEWVPTRVDSAIDWLEEGLYERLARACLAFAVEHRITIDQRGDWERGTSRTLYLGAPSSVVRLCLYEKGHQLRSDPRWVRWEVRVRPKGQKRAEVARWAPSTAQSAAAWLCDLRAALGWERLTAQSVGTVWRPSDDERSRRALIAQYRRVLESWCRDVGSWERVGAEIGSRVEAPHPHADRDRNIPASEGVHFGRNRTPEEVC